MSRVIHPSGPHSCFGMDPVMGAGYRLFGGTDGVKCDAAKLADTLDSLTAERRDIAEAHDRLVKAAREYLAHDGSGIRHPGEWARDWDAGAHIKALAELRAALSEGGSK